MVYTVFHDSFQTDKCCYSHVHDEYRIQTVISITNNINYKNCQNPLCVSDVDVE